MKTPEEWTEQALKETDELLHNREYYLIWAEQIQLDALTQGRKEGREQGIKEALSLHHVLCDKDKEGDFLWHDDEVRSKSILSLLNQQK